MKSTVEVTVDATSPLCQLFCAAAGEYGGQASFALMRQNIEIVWLLLQAENVTRKKDCGNTFLLAGIEIRLRTH